MNLNSKFRIAKARGFDENSPSQQFDFYTNSNNILDIQGMLKFPMGNTQLVR